MCLLCEPFKQISMILCLDFIIGLNEIPEASLHYVTMCPFLNQLFFQNLRSSQERKIQVNVAQILLVQS